MGVGRQALTPDDLAARRFIVERTRAAGAAAFQDEAGNFFLRWPGQYDTPAVATGSQVDSQPSGGSLDGACGVCAGIEVLAALSASGYRSARPVEVVIWTNEEGCRFAPGTMGSTFFADPGGLPEFLKATDTEGTTFEEALRRLDEAFHDVPKRPFGTRFARSVRCGRSWTSWTRSESRSTFRSDRAAPARSPSG
jgi:beta-ureidopropionase / N-carbamoyl-L-amino-acid hydrolase